MPGASTLFPSCLTLRCSTGTCSTTDRHRSEPNACRWLDHWPRSFFPSKVIAKVTAGFRCLNTSRKMGCIGIGAGKGGRILSPHVCGIESHRFLTLTLTWAPSGSLLRARLSCHQLVCLNIGSTPALNPYPTSWPVRSNTAGVYQT